MLQSHKRSTLGPWRRGHRGASRGMADPSASCSGPGPGPCLGLWGPGLSTLAGMIRNKTVFILGAGASCEYGFPLGSQLRSTIIALAMGQPCPDDAPVAIEKAWKLLKQDREDLLVAKYGDELLYKFGGGFQRSTMYSIDAYLKHRTQYRDVGAATIGLIISRCERRDLLFKRPLLYAWLAERMGRTHESLAKNPVTFITFNYDRSLEYAFGEMVEELTRESVPAHKAIESLRIIHMHGSLGGLPRSDVRHHRSAPVQRYDHVDREGQPIAYDYYDLQRWEQTLRLVGERASKKAQEVHKQARDAIAEAEVLCFLGFGFDKDNMKLLGFPYATVETDRTKLIYDGKQVDRPIAIGTAYGLSKARRSEVVWNMLFPRDDFTSTDVFLGKHLESHMEESEFDPKHTCQALLEEHIDTLGANWDMAEG